MMKRANYKNNIFFFISNGMPFFFQRNRQLFPPYTKKAARYTVNLRLVRKEKQSICHLAEHIFTIFKNSLLWFI